MPTNNQQQAFDALSILANVYISIEADIDVSCQILGLPVNIRTPIGRGFLHGRHNYIVHKILIGWTIEIHGDGIGRSGDELMRKLQAAQFVAEYGDQVCPANWQPGKDTLKPGLDLVGKL